MSTTAIGADGGVDNVVHLRVSQAVYEALAAELGDDGHVRLTYEGGTLEVMSPSPLHELIKGAFAMLINGISDEWDVNLKDLGSTTFKTEPGNFEADITYYRDAFSKLRDITRIDLSIDPPPDLIVEVDITSSSSNKFPMFADVRVPEIWRYDLDGFSAWGLADAKYVPITVSNVIAGLPLAEIGSRVRDAVYTSDTGRFSREWRKWLQENRHLHHPT